MDITDELYDKFTQELDRSMYLSSEYGDIIDRFNSCLISTLIRKALKN